jgi:hypothetical protein
MDFTKDYKDLEQFLKITFPDKRNLVTPVERTAEHPVMLHISKDSGIKEFTPRVAARSANVEDTSLPRVCVSLSVLECVVGYGNVLWDFLWGDRENDGFKGGYYIYALPYRLALKPDVKLLSDVVKTNEHWLVGYNRRRYSITPDVIGKLWLDETQTERFGDQKFQYEFTLYLECSTELWVSPDRKVEAGYYEIKVKGAKSDTFWNLDSDHVSVQTLSKDEYTKRKKLKVSLLSLEHTPQSKEF